MRICEKYLPASWRIGACPENVLALAKLHSRGSTKNIFISFIVFRDNFVLVIYRNFVGELEIINSLDDTRVQFTIKYHL